MGTDSSSTGVVGKLKEQQLDVEKETCLKLYMERSFFFLAQIVRFFSLEIVSFD